MLGKSQKEVSMKWVIVGICMVRAGLFAAEGTQVADVFEVTEEEELVVFEDEELEYEEDISE